MKTDAVVVCELFHPKAVVPRKAHDTDACYDLYLPDSAVIAPGEVACLDTGVAIELPEGWEAQIRGRSGLAKKGIWVHNGTVDHLYRNSIMVILCNLSGKEYAFQAGDRIAQMKISRVAEIDLFKGKVVQTKRGGFGSTGR